MEKPLLQSKISARPAILFILALLLATILMGSWYLSQIPNPYIQEVLSLPGNLSRGEAIFQANCGVCHGLQGMGNIGPSLQAVPQRKSQTQLIEQVISGKTPPMPKFQPNSQAMADLLSYLETL
ncbi:MAG: cytochrome c [Snowella sp.]|nr:cytochrome c [Snowella sp.]